MNGNNKGRGTDSLRGHVLVGAGLGLYFGWFFRPSDEPSFTSVIFLSVLITLVYMVWGLYRARKAGTPLGAVLRGVPLNFVLYMAALSVLYARHWALEWGGRVAVMGMTTVMGALAGAWYGYRGGV